MCNLRDENFEYFLYSNFPKGLGFGERYAVGILYKSSSLKGLLHMDSFINVLSVSPYRLKIECPEISLLPYT